MTLTITMTKSRRRPVGLAALGPEPGPAAPAALPSVPRAPPAAAATMPPAPARRRARPTPSWPTPSRPPAARPAGAATRRPTSSSRMACRGWGWAGRPSTSRPTRQQVADHLRAARRRADPRRDRTAKCLGARSRQRPALPRGRRRPSRRASRPPGTPTCRRTSCSPRSRPPPIAPPDQECLTLTPRLAADPAPCYDARRTFKYHRRERRSHPPGRRPVSLDGVGLADGRRREDALRTR